MSNNEFLLDRIDDPDLDVKAAVINGRYPKRIWLLYGFTLVLAVALLLNVLLTLGDQGYDNPLRAGIVLSIIFIILLLLLGMLLLSFFFGEKWFSILRKKTKKPFFKGYCLRVNKGRFEESKITVDEDTDPRIIQYSSLVSGVVYKDMLFLYLHDYINVPPDFCFYLGSLDEDQRMVFYRFLNQKTKEKTTGKHSIKGKTKRSSSSFSNILVILLLTLLGLGGVLTLPFATIDTIQGQLSFWTFLVFFAIACGGLSLLATVYDSGPMLFPKSELFRKSFKIHFLK